MEVRKLLKRSDFTRLKGQGRRVFRPGFVLQWLLQPDEAGIGIGYTASTKAVGNAVKRNRARRRLKAAVDIVGRLNPQAEGAQRQVVLVAKAAVLTQPFEALLTDVRTALSEAGLTVPR